MLAASSSFWDSQFFAAIIGAATATTVFVVGEFYKSWKENRIQLRREIGVIRLVHQEVGFYRNLLHQLRGEVDQVLVGCKELIDNPGRPARPELPFSLPAYDIYPDTLAQLKPTLAFEIENEIATRALISVHFELCHIATRLAHMKQKAFVLVPVSYGIFYQNTKNFRELIDISINKFDASLELLGNESSERHRRLAFIKSIETWLRSL